LNPNAGLSAWIEDLPKIGRFSFSLDEVKEQFPEKNSSNIRNTLYRLSVAGKISSVWRGFYVIVLPEYGLEGRVPPVEYIDQLMSYIGTGYYVALLSAAAFQGASHQAPQSFQVMTAKQLRSKTADGSLLDFYRRQGMQDSFFEQRQVKAGYINISKPAVTALDLAGYVSRAGGISHVASVLSELADVIDFNVLCDEALLSFPCASVQRLGYLLEDVLDEGGLAEDLYLRSTEAGMKFNRANLSKGQKGMQPSFDRKWKIVVNYDVEVDD